MLPQAVKKIEYNELREIDFTIAKAMKRKVDLILDNSETINTPKSKVRKDQPAQKPTSQELSKFYRSLHNTQTKPVILSLIDTYSEDYVSKPISQVWPTVLSELRDENSISSNFGELLKKCDGINLVITPEQK